MQNRQGSRDLCVLLSCLAVACTFNAPPAYAQTAPDAGSLLQQIERARTPAPLPVPPTAPALPAEMKREGAVSVTVSAFRFVGNHLIDQAELAEVLRPFLGRPLGMADLEAAAVAVVQHYRSRGWVVRAYLPRQEIDQGVVTIQVVEGVLGQVLLDGQEARRYPYEQARRVVDAHIRHGEPLATDPIERALLLLDDLPGITVTGNLAAGRTEGETDLLLRFADTPLINGTLELDNVGAYSTGRTRLNGSVNLDSPAGIGDHASLYLLHTQGNDFGRLGYSIPLGHAGWRAGVNYSTFDYRVVEGMDSTSLDGNAHTVGLETSYPLLRSLRANLYLAASLERKRYENRRDAGIESRYGIDALTLTLQGNFFDDLGSGSNGFSLGLGNGRLDQGPLDTNENPALAERFIKWRYTASRQQTVSDDVFVNVALSGQHSARMLDSAERFYLGGAHGVRAYPASEAGGDSGQVLNLELAWRVAPGVVLSGFYDWGRVTSRDATPNTILKGAGLAVAWQTPLNARLKATWARRIGDNPNPLANGDDRDGTLVRNRWWLSASLPF